MEDELSQLSEQGSDGPADSDAAQADGNLQPSTPTNELIVLPASSTDAICVIQPDAMNGLPEDSLQRVRLPDLKRKVEKHYEEVQKCKVTALVHAIAAGRWLNAAKQKLPHGEFHRWLKSNFADRPDGLSPKTCQRYMKLAANFSKVVEALGRTNATRASQMPEVEKLLSGVSIRQALGVIDQGNGRSEERITATGNLPGLRTNKRLPSSDETAIPRMTTGAKVNAAPTSPSADLLSPRNILQSVTTFFGAIDLDPCAEPHEPHNVPAKGHYTLNDDGLSSEHAWSGRVFVHPPLDNVSEWVARAVQEFSTGTITEAVLLVPAHTNSQWFASVSQFACAFLHERLRVATTTEEALHDLAEPMVLIMVGSDDRVRAFGEAFHNVGHVYTPLHGIKAEAVQK